MKLISIINNVTIERIMDLVRSIPLKVLYENAIEGFVVCVVVNWLKYLHY
jgi:hypothetical protein